MTATHRARLAVVALAAVIAFVGAAGMFARGCS